MSDVFSDGVNNMIMLAVPFFLYCSILVWIVAASLQIDGHSPGKALKVSLFQTVLPIPIGILLLTWMGSSMNISEVRSDDTLDIALISGIVIYLLFVWIVTAFIIHGIYLAGVFNSSMLSLILVAAHAIVFWLLYGDGTMGAPLFQLMEYLDLEIPKAIKGTVKPTEG